MKSAQKQVTRVAAASAIAGAVVGMGCFCYALGLPFSSWLRWTIVAGAPIALTLTALAGPSIVRLVVGGDDLSWGGGVLVGLLIAIGPAAIFLVALVPLRFASGEPVQLENWDTGLLALVAAGVAGGLVLRALHGPGAMAAASSSSRGRG